MNLRERARLFLALDVPRESKLDGYEGFVRELAGACDCSPGRWHHELKCDEVIENVPAGLSPLEARALRSLADDPAALRERVRLTPHQEEWVRAAADKENRTFATMVRYIVQCRVVDQAGFIDGGAAETGEQ